jgi:hypothetical protein
MKLIFQILWGPSGLIFIGVILSAIGVILSGIGVFWASKQTANFEHELRIKSDEISELNKEIMKSVIGGDSFCYLTMMSLDNQNNVGILTVVHQGEHPVYDVNARIVDLQKMEKIKDNLSFQNIMQADTNLHIGNMIKGTASTFAPFQLGSSMERGFNIFFSARNGLFTQLLRMKKINNKWTSATKVERDGKIIFEKIDKEFPRNKEGLIIW